MKKVITILKQKDELKSNREQWHRMTPEERISIMDALRENYIKTFLKEDEQGFKRVFKFFKRKKR